MAAVKKTARDALGLVLPVGPGASSIGRNPQPLEIVAGADDKGFEVARHLVESGLGFAGCFDLVAAGGVAVERGRGDGDQHGDDDGGDGQSNEQFDKGEGFFKKPRAS